MTPLRRGFSCLPVASIALLLHSTNSSAIVLPRQPHQAGEWERKVSESGSKFSVERFNQAAGVACLETVTFARGEYIRFRLSDNGKPQFGEIAGISHARRQFRVGAVWLPFGAAYKAERPAPVARKLRRPAALSSVVSAINGKFGDGLTDADRVPAEFQRGAA